MEQGFSKPVGGVKSAADVQRKNDAFWHPVRDAKGNIVKDAKDAAFNSGDKVQFPLGGATVTGTVVDVSGGWVTVKTDAKFGGREDTVPSSIVKKA